MSPEGTGGEWGGDRGTADRGASEIIGVVLLFGLVISGATVIFVSSAAVQNDVRGESQVKTASTTMGKIQSGLATLSYRPNVVVEDLRFPGDPAEGRVRVIESNSRVTFSLNTNPMPVSGVDPSAVDGDAASRFRCATMVELGAITYDRSNLDQTIVYEGGGVWRVPEQGSPRQVSPPSLSYQNGTVSFTAIDLSGSIRTTDQRLRAVKDLRASRRATVEKSRALADPEPAPCTPREELWIAVETPYERPWGAYLAQEFPEGTIENGADGDGVLVVHLQKSKNTLAVLDSDGDGVPDDKDNCADYFNPGQLNSDEESEASAGDPLAGDVCDRDDDGDGVFDNRDATTPETSGNGGFITRDYYQDRNGDTRLDYPTGSTAAGASDVDGDGDDESGKLRKDNCPKTVNPQQRDADGDGVGFVCDEDPDGDDLVAHQDNCAKSYNPQQRDTDDDGRGDVCDADDDGDGHNDPWEVRTLADADNCPRTPNADENEGTDGNFDGSIETWSRSDPDGEGGVRGNECDANDDNDRFDDEDEWGIGDPGQPDECVRDANDGVYDDPDDDDDVPEQCEGAARDIGEDDTDDPLEPRPESCDRDDTDYWWEYKHGDTDGDAPKSWPVPDPLSVADDDGDAEYTVGGETERVGVASQGCVPSKPPTYKGNRPAPSTDVVALTVADVKLQVD